MEDDVPEAVRLGGDRETAEQIAFAVRAPTIPEGWREIDVEERASLIYCLARLRGRARAGTDGAADAGR